MIIKKIHKKWPESKITFKTYKGVIGLCGNIIIEANTMQEMADKTGFTKSTITEYSKTEKPINNWVFKRRLVETNLSKMYSK